MLAAIGAIFGFIGSLAPQLLKFWQAREDRKHELALMDKQLEVQKVLGTMKLDEVKISADTQESLAILQASESKITGVKWVDALLEVVNSLMRPTVVYLYFADYLLIKYATYLLLMKLPNASWENVVTGLWSDFDRAMLGGIMGFLFGNRSMSKYFEKR